MPASASGALRGLLVVQAVVCGLSAAVAEEYVVVLNESVSEEVWDQLYEEYRVAVGPDGSPVVPVPPDAGEGCCGLVKKFSVGNSTKISAAPALMFVALLTPGELAHIHDALADAIVHIEPNSAITGSSSPGGVSCPTVSDTDNWHQKRATNNASLGEAWLHGDNWGEGVTIYVIDSGVACDHAELEGRCTAGFTAVGDEPNTDVSGHGTRVASVAAGKTVGIAPKAVVVSVKCLNKDMLGSIAGCAEAIQWAIEQEADKAATAVINLSLSAASNSYAFRLALEAAASAGFVIVGAAGNQAADACGSLPGAFDQAVVVGASTVSPVRSAAGPSGLVVDEVAAFSNHGPCVDVFAPGVKVPSAALGPGPGGITAGSGTSLSSPYVAGVVAIYLSTVDPLSTAADARAWLLTHAQSGLANLPSESPDKLAHVPCTEAPPAPLDGDRHAENCFGVYEAVLAPSPVVQLQAEYAAGAYRCWRVACPAGLETVRAQVVEQHIGAGTVLALGGQSAASSYCVDAMTAPGSAAAFSLDAGPLPGSASVAFSCGASSAWTVAKTFLSLSPQSPPPPETLGISLFGASAGACAVCASGYSAATARFYSFSTCFFAASELAAAEVALGAGGGAGGVESWRVGEFFTELHVVHGGEPSSAAAFYVRVDEADPWELSQANPVVRAVALPPPNGVYAELILADTVSGRYSVAAVDYQGRSCDLGVVAAAPAGTAIGVGAVCPFPVGDVVLLEVKERDVAVDSRLIIDSVSVLTDAATPASFDAWEPAACAAGGGALGSPVVLQTAHLPARACVRYHSGRTQAPATEAPPPVVFSIEVRLATDPMLYADSGDDAILDVVPASGEACGPVMVTGRRSRGSVAVASLSCGFPAESIKEVRLRATGYDGWVVGVAVPGVAGPWPLSGHPTTFSAWLKIGDGNQLLFRNPTLDQDGATAAPVYSIILRFMTGAQWGANSDSPIKVDAMSASGGPACSGVLTGYRGRKTAVDFPLFCSFPVGEMASFRVTSQGMDSWFILLASVEVRQNRWETWRSKEKNSRAVWLQTAGSSVVFTP